ncbi:hypothetical protein L6R50_01490 [Myxococcota bacterium]|nr:hypothetical protein [Myxococcota bacterium]
MSQILRSAIALAGVLSPCVLAAGCAQRACDEPGTICTYLGVIDDEGNGVPGAAAEGTCREAAHTYQVVDMEFGPDGRLYFPDWNNHRIARIEPGQGPDGCDTFNVITGNTQLGDGPISTEPGVASDMAWNHPTNLAFKSDGTLVVAAWHNSRVLGIDPEDDACWLIAGTGGRGYNSEGLTGPETVFDLVAAVAVDADDNVYVMDQANQMIRMIDTAGIVHEVAGEQRSPGYSGDGGDATAAQIYQEVGQEAYPGGKISIDKEGGILYFADTVNHRIRTVDLATGVIDTLVGTGSAGFSGDGGPAGEAQINAPRDVEYDEAGGRLFLADTGNHCVRVVDLASGTISTYAGVCGTPGLGGDHGPATEALLYNPFGIELAADGTLFIADTFNSLIRTVAPG